VNQTAFFSMLGAPLANSRWSWGAIRPEDGAVFLRVWEDRIRAHDDAQFAQVTFNARFRGRPVSLGHRERLEQVDRVRDGAQCYLIMCRAVDTAARPRRIAWFNADEVFPGGRVVELDGEWWVEILPGVAVRSVIVRPQGMSRTLPRMDLSGP